MMEETQSWVHDLIWNISTVVVEVHWLIQNKSKVKSFFFLFPSNFKNTWQVDTKLLKGFLEMGKLNSGMKIFVQI